MDVFRRHDIGGFAKTLWVIFLIVVPFFGVFVYILAEHKGMTERTLRQQQVAQQQFDQYVREAAAASGDGGPTAEIQRAKQLLDSGAITPQEFEQIKLRRWARLRVPLRGRSKWTNSPTRMSWGLSTASWSTSGEPLAPSLHGRFSRRERRRDRRR